MNTEQLPQWDLSDLFPSLESKEYRDELKNIVEEKEKFMAYKQVLEQGTYTTPDFLQMLRHFEQMEIRLLHIYAYSHFQYDVDTQNEFVKAEHERAKKIVTDITTSLEFFSQAIKNMPKDDFDALYNDPQMGVYKRYVEVLKIYEPFTKSEEIEQILLLKSLYGAQAWGQFHTELASGLDFGVLEVDGKEEKMTPARLANIISNTHSQQLRKKAYEAARKPFAQMNHLFAFAYNAVAADFEKESVAIRGYASGLARSSLGDEVKVEHVDAMQSVTERYVPMFQEYYKWKQKQLGVDTLYTYDLMASTSTKRPKLTFTEAKEYVLSCYQSFSPEFAKCATRFFEEKWIDARDSGTKYAGAYSWAMEKHPYILLNFQPSIQQAMTMIHELGHGIHALLAGDKQPFLLRNTSKVIAETASQFSEMLLLDYFEKVLDDQEIVKDLFIAHIDDILYCLGSTLTVTAFEREAHKIVETEGLSKDTLQQLWTRNLHTLYGDTVTLTQYDEAAWARIPHIFQTPFYYFTYPMSLCVVLSLYELYLEDKESFVKNYTDFLAAGGSKAAPDLIEKTFGITFGDEAFFTRAFHVVERLIKKVQSFPL